MVCRGCGHVYQISSGIPNMVCYITLPKWRLFPLINNVFPQLLAEHEVGR